MLLLMLLSPIRDPLKKIIHGYSFIDLSSYFFYVIYTLPILVMTTFTIILLCIDNIRLH